MKPLNMDLFDSNQVKIINQAINAGFNPEYYSNPDYDWFKMQQCFLAQKRNIDLSQYVKDFDGTRLSIIYDGLRMGLDVSEYANPEFGIAEMVHRRICLIQAKLSAEKGV